MITTSDAFKQAITSDNREFAYRIIVNGTTSISPSDITRIEIEESGTSGEALVPGSFCKNSCTMNLLASAYSSWQGSYFTVEIACNGSEWIPLGKFWVYNVKSSGNKIYYDIEAYNVPSWWMQTPDVDSYSVSDFLSDIVDNTGMSIINPQVLTLENIGTLLYPALDLLPDDSLYPLSVPIEIPSDSTNMTLLGFIAGYDGYNTKITRNGNVLFFKYDGNSSIQYCCAEDIYCSEDQLIGYYDDISEASDTTMWVERESEFQGSVTFDDTDFTVGAIMVTNGQDTYQVGSGSSISYMNPFINSANEIDMYYRYLIYRGCNVKWRGNPACEIGDVLRVELGQSQWGNSLIMRQKFVLEGAFSHTFECLVNEASEKVIGTYSPMQLKIKAVYNQIEQMYATAMETIFGAQDGYFNFIDENESVLTFNDISNGATIAGFQITDSPTVTANTKGWRFIYGGLFFSSDGFQSVSHFALTNDGSVNADAINTGTLSAIEVNGVTIKASDMYFGDPDDKYVEAVTTSQEDGIIFQGNGVINFKSTGDFDVLNMESDGTTTANRIWLTNSNEQNDLYLRNTLFGNGNVVNQVHLFSTSSAVTTFFTNWNFSDTRYNANNIRLNSTASSNRIDLYNRTETGTVANQLYLSRTISSTSPQNVAYIANNRADSSSKQNSLELKATSSGGTVWLNNYQSNLSNFVANYIYLASGSTYNTTSISNYFPASSSDTSVAVANSFNMASNSGANTMVITNYDFTESESVANRITMASNSSNSQLNMFNYFPETNVVGNGFSYVASRTGASGTVSIYNNDSSGSEVSKLYLSNSYASLSTSNGTNLTLYTNGTFRLYDGSDSVSLGSTADGYLTVKTNGEGAYKMGWATISGYTVLVATS